MILGANYEEVADKYNRHKEGDTSLCSEIGQQVAREIVQIRAEAKAHAARVRALAEDLAWDELNAMAMAGDQAAEAEVIERAVYESGKETPIYDALVDKNWSAMADNVRAADKST
jgi:hypothetical protein